MKQIERERAYIETFEVQRALRRAARSIPGCVWAKKLADRLSEPVIVLSPDYREREEGERE